MELFWQYIIKFRWRVTACMTLAILEGATSVFLLDFLNHRILNKNAFNVELFVVFIGMLALFFLLVSGSQIMLSWMGHSLVNRVREQIIKQLLDTHYDQIQQQGKGKFIACLNYDIGNFQRLFFILPTIIPGIFVTLSTLVYLCLLSPSLTLFTTIWLLLTGFITAILIGRCAHHMRLYRAAVENMTADFHSSIDGNRELKMNTIQAESFFKRTFLRHTRYVLRQNNLNDAYYLVSQNFFDVMLLLLIGLVFFVALRYDLASSESAITVSLTILYIRSYLLATVEAIPMINYARISANKILSLNMAAYKPEFKHVLALNANWKEIRLQHVTYTYPPARKLGEDEVEIGMDLSIAELYDREQENVNLNLMQSTVKVTPFVLENVNVSIMRGQITFIVGKNGAGKSTLFNVLAGVLPPRQGRLVIDKSVITADQTIAYMQKVAAVFSDYHLFSSIPVPHTAANMQLIQKWLKILRLQDKVVVDNFTYSTTHLSMGQRKRLALLSAIASQRPVIMLDEWAAEQDPSYRRFFYEQILPELKAMGKTLVVVSHDEDFFKYADKILLCQDGKVTELMDENRATLAYQAVTELEPGSDFSEFNQPEIEHKHSYQQHFMFKGLNKKSSSSFKGK